jgi:septum formation protein
VSSLILASASPRRREMLERVGISIEVQAANIDETPRYGEEPEAYVARIARGKAEAIGRRSGRWVLAADTTVTVDGEILGKAEHPGEAAAMLRRLSDRTHRVLTAFVLLGERGGEPHLVERVVASQVSMVELDETTIAEYVACGEWRGKAGAYAIQGIAAALITGVNGSVTSIAGLPLAEVLAALREVGGPLPRLTAGIPV